MKRRDAIIMTVFAIILLMTPAMAKERICLGSAEKVYTDIYYDNIVISNQFKNPILKFQGSLYVSMRDIAEHFRSPAYRVQWEEKERTASLCRIPDKKTAVQSKAAAKVIAKAVMKGQCPSVVTEHTQYIVCEDDSCSPYEGNRYIVYVCQNALGDVQESKENVLKAKADAIISIWSENGAVELIKLPD